jgi:hypothetical protein
MSRALLTQPRLAADTVEGADMPNATCTIEGCERRRRARGLCSSHLRRWQEHGDPLSGPPIRQYVGAGPQSRSLEDRLWSKAEIGENPLDCWLWVGALNPGNGYGVINVDGKKRFAHRVAYELSIDAIGTGLEIDHLCRVRACVNPLHLEAVPASTNVRRQPRRAVTHCPQGHPYSGDNLYEWNGHRKCRTCQRERRAA